jgi:hypothetical protein
MKMLLLCVLALPVMVFANQLNFDFGDERAVTVYCQYGDIYYPYLVTDQRGRVEYTNQYIDQCDLWHPLVRDGKQSTQNPKACFLGNGSTLVHYLNTRAPVYTFGMSYEEKLQDFSLSSGSRVIYAVLNEMGRTREVTVMRHCPQRLPLYRD